MKREHRFLMNKQTNSKNKCAISISYQSKIVNIFLSNRIKVSCFHFIVTIVTVRASQYRDHFMNYVIKDVEWMTLDDTAYELLKQMN